jgi:uncharacterized protein YggE
MTILLIILAGGNSMKTKCFIASVVSIFATFAVSSCNFEKKQPPQSIISVFGMGTVLVQPDTVLDFTP